MNPRQQLNNLAAFTPGAIWPDDKGVHINAHGGGVLLHGSVYYWYGEHKTEGAAGNRAHVGVHVYSSTDLYNWRDEGIALQISDDQGSDIQNGCILERPKVIFNSITGKFVMWFHLELVGEDYHSALCGIAVADQPAGPFSYINSFRLCPGIWPANVTETVKQWKGWMSRNLLEGQMSRDMTLFVDDDGAAYQFSASENNETLHIYRLTDDFLGLTGEYVRDLVWGLHEAPAVFKCEGKYFLFSSGCTGWSPNPGRISVADTVFGPWIELGNPCIGSEQVISTTFESQSTFVLPVAGKSDSFIFMADRWRPENAIDGRYVWLPVKFDNGMPRLEWLDSWDLSVFGSD